MAEQPPLGEVFLASCAEHAGRRAVVDSDEELTYGQFADRVTGRARVLGDLLRPDEYRIALHAANSADHLISYYALLVAGRLPFLVDPQFGATELQGIRDSSGVDAFLTDRPGRFPLPSGLVPVPGSRHVLARPTDPGPDVERPEPRQTTATCRFTSGTTGAPKCLEFSHTAVHGAALNWTSGTGLVAGDRVLCLAAFTNGLAFNTSLLPVFLVGAELHVHRGLPTSDGIAKALRRSAATRLVAFPLVYRLLAEAPAPGPDAFSDLRLAVSAAAVLDPAVREAFESRYRVRIADYYGIAETGPCTFERDPGHTEGLGTALPGVSLRIVPHEDGGSEIRVRTPSMATCYLNVPGGLEKRLDSEGYYRTGDRGLIRQDRLYVTGRLGGPVNLAGRKVDPTEIERVVLAVDGVRDTAVFADQDARGETVLHAVVCGSLDRADVVNACRARLAPYKVPGRITLLPAIPRSSAGKVRLAELRGLVTETP
ncbi:acyl--CoA ligase [Streptomyces sp. NBC_01754]|uniref:class I adenylate-forming enzyme family protein n=1 Tax=Streptomyces sp. NBC_01754 TaxID=2975930 RepID=UPI002DDBD516|nr:class I adenylate-forming enzyme family protein [Streptomyces sp. NBC_01754]WSC93395.1 acyl--CoA ligase [Streptomyces sp. NBC_01754]